MPQPLNSKESSLFRQVVKFYEAKQNKKGLKAAEQILKKNPNHGETMAMKALIINSQGKHDEAMGLCKESLKYDMRSHVCWHVYGLLWRSERNLDEAIRAYRMALKIEPESPQILRDLSLLQVQMRDYLGYISSRRTMLTSRPQNRQNWTALAIAHHLAGNYDEAEKVLSTYEGTLKSPPSKLDLEHSEAALYKIAIIAESGDLQKALDSLKLIADDNLDRVSVMEMEAEYLLRLGKQEEAEKAYRALIDRNPEYRAYYDGLEKALGLSRDAAENLPTLKDLYAGYAGRSLRGDAARWIPLSFLQGADFKEAVDIYLRRMFAKGAPSTFANVKGLYSDQDKKRTIHDLVIGYQNADLSEFAELQSNGPASASKKDRFETSVLYFLAQHYNFHKSRDLDKAHDYISKALERSPKSVEYHMTMARIWKHRGNFAKAAEVMEAGRKADERDRAINSKSAKYQIRNRENEKALQTMSKFTRNEAVGGTLGDLHEMQCVWFLTEDGESFLRQRNLGMALKRFTSVFDIFEVWEEDQYDFHTFSLRKGQIRAYIDMVRWEDRLRDHPFFSRASVGATKAFILLFDHPELAHGTLTNGIHETSGDTDENLAERKKAAKKAKREKQKLEKKEADKQALDKASAPNSTSTDVKKPDSDPKGLKLLETAQPLEDALKFLAPALAFQNAGPEILRVGFELHLRRKKWLQALKCLLAAENIDHDDPFVHEQAVKFHQTIEKHKASIDEKTLHFIQLNFKILPESGALGSWNEEFISRHSKSAPHILHAARTKALIDSESTSDIEKLVFTLLDLPSLTIEDACRGHELLKETKSAELSRYHDRLTKMWPHATFSTEPPVEKLAGLKI